MSRALVIAAALVAVIAAAPVARAQAPAPPAVTLEPGAAPPTSAPAPAAPAPAAPQPQVLVVGPDGKLSPQDKAEPTNFFIDGGGPVVDQPQVLSGPVPELHVVRRGDTLWDICFLYFNDPWQWPKIWSYNAQITNPHWIYPGDLVRLLPRGMFAQRTPDPDATGPRPEIDALPAPQRRVDAAIRQTAFVEKAGLDAAGTVDGAVDEKTLLGDGDSVYLTYPAGKPPKVGARYSIYTPGQSVKDLGAYVRVLGTLEIVSVKQDKRARGLIVQANQEIERGARVGPLLTTFKNVAPTLPKVDAQGTVVAMLSYDQLIGDGEVVFIDLGKQSGVAVGNRMFVVRRGDGKPAQMSDQVGQDDRDYPARALGEVVIIDVGERISVGLVTIAVQEMSVGDLVMMQASK